jgi:flagellar assembly factor FliW
MEVQTTRFGRVEFAAEDVFRFPEGLPGLAGCRDWVILSEGDGPSVAWLQSIQRPEIGLAVVCPRRFVPGYRLRVARRELEPLKLDSPKAALLLAIVTKTERALALNLRAPVVINLDRRLGRQVIANGGLPLQLELDVTPTLKKTA